MDTRICLTTSNLSASWTNKNEELNIKSVTFSVNEVCHLSRWSNNSADVIFHFDVGVSPISTCGSSCSRKGFSLTHPSAIPSFHSLAHYSPSPLHTFMLMCTHARMSTLHSFPYTHMALSLHSHMHTLHAHPPSLHTLQHAPSYFHAALK